MGTALELAGRIPSVCVDAVDVRPVKMVTLLE